MTNGKRKGREGEGEEDESTSCGICKKEGNGRLKGGEAGVGEIGRFTAVSTP